MQRMLTRVLCTVVLLLPIVTGSAAAQTDWPTPPDNWWTALDDGGYPSATFEVNMGMAMTITQSIESVEGAQITMSTTVSMMGNAMPGQRQVIDATTLTPQGSIALMQGFGGPPSGNQPTPEQALAAMNAMVDRIEDTTCQVGGQELECTVYEVALEGMTSRIWHAPAIPPVFMGGIVRSEASMTGQSFVTTMTSYSGAVIE